ncbi:MAG: DUF885 domain-containing protein [Alphaproteobacteria bacterium]|nr:DUF885 domain-containing protein [Alphaproteobacteria bacterium]
MDARVMIAISRRSALLAASASLLAASGGLALSNDTESAKLARVFADSDEELLKLAPLNATWRGDMRYADQYGDLITNDYMRAYMAYAERDLARISSVNRIALPATGQMLYDVFRYQTEFTLESYRTGAAQINTQDFALDHLNGAHMSFPQAMAAGGQYPFNSVGDYENALKLQGGFALFLDRSIEYMRRGIKRGNVHLQLIVNRMIGQMRDIVTAGVDKSPFLTPTASFPASIGAADRARLTAAFRASIGERIIPVHKRLLDFLEQEYLPAARTGTPGLAALPSGRALYNYYLELFNTTRMSAEEIFAAGEAEVARVLTEMERVKAKVGFKGTLRDFFAFLKSDAQFKFATPDAYLRRYDEIARRVTPMLPKYFSALATLPFEIRPVPQEMASATGGAYYILGTADGSRPGVFYVNTSDLPSRTSPIMTALFLHEAIPGHHFQGSLAVQDQNLPAFLRFLWNSGYVEGWALYCERLGIEMGLYDDPYQYFGMLDLEMFRAARLVVDTGIHAKRWSRDQAIDYMLAHTSLDRNFIALEVDRYIVTPGQATSYKVGELLIKRLRAKAESALGKRFDVRAFHDQVLNTGAIPLHVLEAKIKRWVEGGG